MEEKYTKCFVLLKSKQADLEHNLTISGYEEYEEELQTFRVNDKGSYYYCGGRNFKIGRRIIDNLASKN